MVFPPLTWVLLVVSAVLCSVGFYKFVYFMSVGYGLSVAGIGLTIFIIALIRGNLTPAMAVLCFTLPKGQPLVYTGQEVGVTRRIEFFEKDPVTDWSANQYTDFFKSLIKFRHDNAKVLAPGEQGAPLVYLENDNPNVFAFSRGEGKNKIIVVVNLSSEPASANIPLDGKYYSAFGGQEYSPKAESFELGAWQYCLMSKKK